MLEIIIIGVGAFCGGILRNLLSKYNQNYPLGTLIVNIFGSFLVGFLTQKLNSDILKLMFITGFCGGLTTFSTFILEITKDKKLGYLMLSLVLGILSVFLGSFIGTRL